MSSSETYEVRNLVFTHGERFPALLTRETGIPDFDSSLYVLTQLRARNLSSSTLLAATRSVMFGYQVLEFMDIDLQGRLNQGKLLELGEVDRLVDIFFWTHDRLREALMLPTSSVVSNRVLQLESVRKSAPSMAEVKTVGADTAAIRLMYFRDFMKWKIDRSMYALSFTHENFKNLREAKEITLAALNSRIPRGSRRNDLEARQGLSEEEVVSLLAVVQIESLQNPWKSLFIRVRNRLIVHLLLNLGLRKGELLGIKIGDMNLERNELTIHRRADDADDTRSIQPNAKTSARILFLEQDLAAALHTYVVKFRRQVEGARRHPFLLVANGSGAPMSIAALDVVFTQIKHASQSGFYRLSPHVLRHTWNDKFSELMDLNGIGEAKEEEVRSYAMGWKQGSGTALTYTRRHVRKKARVASLKLQENMTKLGGK